MHNFILLALLAQNLLKTYKVFDFIATRLEHFIQESGFT